MASDGGPRAWAFLRRNLVYRAARRAAFEPPAFEAAAFPVRIQSMADRHALKWGQLAWEDPHGTGEGRSAFWAEAPMLDGEWATQARPLVPLVANAGGRLSGLRLADGTLILKIENRSEAAQVRMAPGLVHAPPGPDSGMATGLVLTHEFGSGPAQAIKRVNELESLVARGPGPDAPRPADLELLLEEADALADRIAVIHQGRVIAEGTSAEIKSRAADRRVRCITSVNRDEVAALPGVARAEASGQHLEILTGVPEELLRTLLAMDPELRDLQVTEAGLEDAFLTLVGNGERVESA